MAIYHCSLRIFSRSEGHSAVAAAAYRAGALLKDERTGRIHRYEKRAGVVCAFILAPPYAPQNLQNRAVLWNAAERAENRKNSRVAREVILALPHELSPDMRHSLCRDMAQWLVGRYGVAVDTAIHSPAPGDGHDGRNHHAHLLFTTREVTPEGFGKKTRMLDDKEQGPQEIELIRAVWETLANDALKQAGFEGIQIDRRTLENQGVERIPQIHIGPASKASPREDFEEKAEEEDEGEKEGSTGKAGAAGGGAAANLSKNVKDTAGSKIDYKAIDRKQSRAAFVGEIKRLNEKRAAYPDTPLAVQIENIEKQIEVLDGRVKHLETLHSKTSLPQAIKKSLSGVIRFSKEIFVSREKSRKSLLLSTQEKQARAERQIARYGKAYRTGLHERIKNMYSQIEQLETLKSRHTAYNVLIEKIDRELSSRPAITTAEKGESDPSQVRVSDKEFSLKLALKAQIVRNVIPEKFRPPPKGTAIIATAEKTRTLLKTDAQAIENKPIKAENLNQDFNFKNDVKAEFKNRTALRNLTVQFNVLTVPKQKLWPDANPPWRQTSTIQIRENEKAIIQHPTEKPELSELLLPGKSERKNWFIPANEKTRPLQEAISSKIATQRGAVPQIEKQEPDASILKSEFNIKNSDEKIVVLTTYEAVKKKIRQEAQEKRDRIPPAYRTEPYNCTETEIETHQEQENPDKNPESLNSEQFKTAAHDPGTASENHVGHLEIDNPAASHAQPRPKMSEHFNKVSFDGVSAERVDYKRNGDVLAEKLNMD